MTVDVDLVTIDYAAPDGDWGIDGTANIRALVQLLVWTASEEPGIHPWPLPLNARSANSDGPMSSSVNVVMSVTSASVTVVSAANT